MTERAEDEPSLDERTRVGEASERTAVLGGDADGQPGLALALPRAPTTIGRYRVTKELGRGGMGVVYEAHDPALDRTVAIKLVRPTRARSDARARLAREAKVLARLSHPNVVEVFEIGEHDGQLFLAMELVRGSDLRRWGAAAVRSRAEILDVMMDAGRGLAAAHAAGLVHRDFKPDNVMVGEDGRVRVLDFGLARAAFAASSTDAGHVDAALDEPGAQPHGTNTFAPEERLTQTGLAMGTPAYMAPEQFSRAVDDPRVDQFAFGVALFEMLAGRRPFKARSYEELARVTARGELHEPRAHDIPRRIYRVLRRTLAPAPEDRFVDMNAVLAALQAARRPGRGRWAALGLCVAAAGTVGAVMLARPSSGAACPSAAQLHDELWGAAQQQPVREAILGTAVAYAEPTWQQVDATIEHYTQAWAGAREDVCAQLRARDVDAHADQRLACLRHRRVALVAALDVLARADGATVHNARTTVARLPSVEACNGGAFAGDALGAIATPELEELERHLATARAHYDMGRYAAGLQELQPLAHATPNAPPGLRAALQLTHGQLEAAMGRALAGAEAFEAAYFAALESEQLDLACRAASLVAAEPAVPYRERWQWAEHARAALERHGGADEELAWGYERAMCALQSDSGKLDEAIAHCERALAMVERRDPADPEATALALADLGTVVAVAEDRERAYALRQRALALSEQALGAQHPVVAKAASDLGFAALALGKHDEASALAERALVIRRATLGDDHPDVVLTEHLQVRLFYEQRRYAESKALAEQGLAKRQRVYGDTHPLVAKSLYALALAQEDLGEHAAALASMDRVAEIEEQLHPLNIDRLPTLREQARMEFEIGAGPSEGRKHLERAWEIVRDSQIPADHPLVLDLCHGYGETLLELGEATTALPYLERFVAGSTSERIRPHVEFVLARALVAAGGDRERAFGLVHAGIERWGGSADAFHQSQVADMREWLAAHGGDPP